MKKMCAGLGLACTVAWTLSAAAGVKWYAVDPMGEEPYMPDKAPYGGKEGAPIQIIAAKGEYEPGSFVLSRKGSGTTDRLIGDRVRKDRQHDTRRGGETGE